MDEPETPAQAGPRGPITTTITSNTAGDGMSLQQTVLIAAGLGWAIAELLGRCFLLKEVQPTVLDWAGDKLVKLQEIYTPREKIRALVEYIHFLADSLGVSSCVIEHENDPDNGKAYVDVLEEDVRLLTQHDLDPALGVTREQLRGKINERLFFWDLRIHDILQDRPTEVHKAYLVGRTLAAFRWYQGQQNMMRDSYFIEKVRNEYVPLLQPYVSPFTTDALAYSIGPWWKAISGGQVQTDQDGEVPKELQKQADIWFSLVTNERNALSYAPPFTGSRWYILQVLRVSWPLFLVGGLVIILILALLLFVIISNINPITKEVTAVVALLTTLGITHTVVNTTGDILQKAVSEVTGIIRGSVIDNIWHSNQQQDVNKATFIPPAIATQQIVQNK